MAPSFVSAGTFVQGTAANCSIAAPGSMLANDIVFGIVYTQTTSIVVTPPDGTWTQATALPVIKSTGQAIKLNIFIHVATGAEAGPYVFTHTSTYRQGQAFIYRGVNTTTPIDVANAVTNAGSGDNGSVANTSVTTTADNELLLYFMTCWAGGAPTVPSGFTSRFTNTVNASWGVSDKLQATAGASGNVAGTFPGSGGTAAWLGALKNPAAAGANTNQFFALL